MGGIAKAGGIFDEREGLIEHLRQGPGAEKREETLLSPAAPVASRWTLRRLRDQVEELQDYTLSGVWYYLHRLGIGLRSSYLRQRSPDADYLEKRQHLLACLHEAAVHPGRKVLLFLDEMGYYRWPAEAPVWWPNPPEAPLKVPRGKENNQQWRIIGALNALTGRVTYLDNYIVGRKQVIQMYELIERVYPREEDIFVVQDNWSVHQHEDVLQALQDHPRIQPVRLPTYSPWLNPIEKLWRWLRQDVLKQHRYINDWKLLRQKVRDFLNEFADGSEYLLHYVGLLGNGCLANACLPSSTDLDC